MRVNVENHLLAQLLAKYLGIYIPYNIVNLIRVHHRNRKSKHISIKHLPCKRMRGKTNLSVDRNRKPSVLCIKCKCEQELCLHIIYFCIMYIFYLHSDVVIKLSDKKHLWGKMVYFISQVTVHPWGKSGHQLKQEPEAKTVGDTAYDWLICLSYAT